MASLVIVPSIAIAGFGSFRWANSPFNASHHGENSVLDLVDDVSRRRRLLLVK
jgi:hypothetical protein